MFNPIINKFPALKQSYLSLLEDLDSPILPYSITKLADNYFDFLESIHTAFKTDKFEDVYQSWVKFEQIYESQKINSLELANILHQNNLEYIILKSYLKFIIEVQETIASSFLEHFIYDLNHHNAVKKHLPPFFLFTNWLNNSEISDKNQITYFNLFSQEHINSLSYFNNIPQLENFIDKIFLLPKNLDDRSFDNTQYDNFNTKNLFSLNKKELFFDSALKNNSISIPEQFIDYITYCISKFKQDIIKSQTFLDSKEFKEFLKSYEKQKMEFIFPAKNIKFKTVKI